MKPWGAILSSMGGRVSVQSMIDMGDAAGYSGRIISLAWKIQSEPEAVIGGYAENQRKTSSQVRLPAEASVMYSNDTCTVLLLSNLGPCKGVWRLGTGCCRHALASNRA